MGYTCGGGERRPSQRRIRIEQNAYDLVLLDIMLPGLDGYLFLWKTSPHGHAGDFYHGKGQPWATV